MVKVCVTVTTTQITRFCVLRYNRGWRTNVFDTGAAILVALLDESGKIILLTDMQWEKLVRSEDLSMLKPQLDVYSLRSVLEPKALFEDLCAVKDGPLLTQEMGPGLPEVLSSIWTSRC